MTTIIGVRFREVGKIYNFDPGREAFNLGDKVIVETSKGIECGTIVLPNRQVQDNTVVRPLKEIIRKANKNDLDTLEKNKKLEHDAFVLCKKKIIEHNMPEMKLIAAEYSFDGSKIMFCFTSEGRVDFRELVRDLAGILHARIEMKQVGVRDETKIVGGIGSCGRPLCCHSWLPNFVPVAIKMAKEQNLSLNPQKISGVCGKLMCCLNNEVEAYKYLNSKLPKRGDTAHTSDGRDGTVYDVGILRQKIRVIFTDEEGNREIEEFNADELTYTARKKGTPHNERIKGDMHNIKKVEKSEDKNISQPKSKSLTHTQAKQAPQSQSRPKQQQQQKSQPQQVQQPQQKAQPQPQPSKKNDNKENNRNLQQKKEQNKKPRKPFYKKKNKKSSDAGKQS